MTLKINRSLLNPNFQGYKLAGSNSILASKIELPAPPLTLHRFERFLEGNDQHNRLGSISYAISSSKSDFNNMLVLSKEHDESEEKTIVYLDHMMNLLFMTSQGYVESVFPMTPNRDLLSSISSSFSFPVLKSSDGFVICSNGFDSVYVFDSQSHLLKYEYQHPRPFVLKACHFDKHTQTFQWIVYELYETPSTSTPTPSQKEESSTLVTWFHCHLWTISVSSSSGQRPTMTSLGQSTLAPSYVEFDGKEEWYLLFKAPFQWTSNQTALQGAPVLETWHQTLHLITLMFRFPNLFPSEDLQVSCVDHHLQLTLKDTVVFEKMLGGAVTSMDWVLVDQHLTLNLNKSSANTHWPHCFQETYKWSLPGTETEEIDLESKPMYLYGYPSQRVLANDQYPFLMSSSPHGFCTQYDVDGLVFDLQLQHTSTLHALGYILPSKTDLRFSFCTETCAVLIEQEKNIFIYKPSKKLKNEGKQFLISFEGEVIGYSYFQVNQVGILTSKGVYLFPLP